MSKHTHLNDDEKRCLMIEAMASPEAKTKAEAAVDYTETYEEAAKRLRENYELNRDLHSHHLSELLQVDHFRHDRRDLERLLDWMERNTRGLKMANGYTADQVFCMHFEGQMAPSLRTQWKIASSDSTDPPLLSEMMTFLKKQLRASSAPLLAKKDKEPTAVKKNRDHAHRVKPSSQSSGRTVLQTHSGDRCPVCHTDHSVFACTTFRQLSPQQRRDWAKTNKVCFNCFSSKHHVEVCPSKYRCRECKSKHHTLLHYTNSVSETDEATVNLVNTITEVDSTYVVTVTAIVRVTSGGLVQKARAQLDTGACVTVITRSLASTLKTRRIPNSSINVSGLTGDITTSHQVEVTLLGDPKLGYQNEKVVLKAHVVDSIPPASSQADVTKFHQLPFLKGLPLADLSYSSAAKIDLLLDIGTFYSCCKRETLWSSIIPSIRADKTIFGWIVGGTDTRAHQTGTSNNDVTCFKLSRCVEDPERLLRQFWEIERLPLDEPSHS